MYLLPEHRPVRTRALRPSLAWHFRGFVPLTDRICRACGNELGRTVDQALVRNSPDALFRVVAGVSGRSSHDEVSPFYSGLYSGQTIRINGPHPRLGFDVLWEIQPGTEPGTVIGCEANQIIFRRGDEYLPYPLPGEDEDIEGYLRFIIRKHDLQDASVDFVFAGEGDDNPLMTATIAAIKAVATASEGASITPAGRMEPGFSVRTEAALPITHKYTRGIAKIAFHYLLAHAGNIFSGNESVFDDVKRYIKTGEGFVGRIALIQLPIVAESDRLAYYAHVVKVAVGYDEIVARVQLFVGPDVQPPSWVVRLAKNPAYVYTGSFGHAFVLNGDTEGDGHQGEITKLTSIPRSLLP